MIFRKNLSKNEATSLEEESDYVVLNMLERCDGKDSPLIVECLRRLMRHKMHVEEQQEIQRTIQEESAV